ncbi:DNA-directed RNA polymerase subunit D [Candidatus Pacearchaeota archaeon]|nr:DNA-directed RNA polymerase subunit D [Candidatus Pacearchaeota archaeon]
METIQNTPEKLILRIEANQQLANALRRSISEIPVLAVDEVEIFKNDSALYDEVLAHRIGLIPLKTEKSMTAKTKIDFKLSKKGPCTVYAEDLHGAGKIVQPKIPITILGEGHQLELVATARLGKGIDHAKHIPGLCYYRHLLEIKSSLQVDKIIQNSKGVIKPEKKGAKWICDIDDASVTEINKIDKEAIKDSDELIFIVESYGNMPAKEMLLGAVEALEENLKYFEKEIK